MIPWIGTILSDQIHRDRKMVVARSWGRRAGVNTYCIQSSIGKDEEVREMDAGDGVQ